MILSIGFYLLTDKRDQYEKISAIVSEFIKVGIRCYIKSSEQIPQLIDLDPQYSVQSLIDCPQGESDQSVDSNFLNREREFCDAKKIRILITDNLSFGKFIKKIPGVLLIDVNELHLGHESALRIAGKIIKQYITTYYPQVSYAVFDVGTNNILLLWAAFEKGEIIPVHRASRISAMGKNMRDGMLTQAGIKRTRKILKDFLGLTRCFDPKIIITGTSCSRESHNIGLITHWLKTRYDIDYKILTEDEEAELVGLANRKLFREFSEIIIFDIGGGSTEFIYYKGDQLIYKKSLRLGIRRLENYYPQDRQRKIDFIRQALSDLPSNLISKPILVGIGGTVTNISAVKKRLQLYDSSAVHKSLLHKNDIENYLKLFTKLSLKNIAGLMPFEPLRANVITTGLLIVKEIMAYFGTEQIYVSDYGLQFGVLEKIKSKEHF